jgi:hypothetical protein
MTRRDWKEVMAEGAWKNGPWFVLFLALVLPFSYAAGKGTLAAVERYVTQSEENNRQLQVTVVQIGEMVKQNGQQILRVNEMMLEAKELMKGVPAARELEARLLSEMVEELRGFAKNAQAPTPKSGGE